MRWGLKITAWNVMYSLHTTFEKLHIPSELPHNSGLVFVITSVLGSVRTQMNAKERWHWLVLVPFRSDVMRVGGK